MANRLLGRKIKRYFDEMLILELKCYHNRFKITLQLAKSVPNGTMLKQQDENLKISLTKQQDANQNIFIERTVFYKMNSNGEILLQDIKIPYTKNYFVRGFLTLSPKFYLPLGMLKYLQNLEMLKKDFPIGIHPKKYQPSSSKFIPYKIAKPHKAYRG